MDEDISMDGTLSDTSIPLGESIDQIGDLLDPEQVEMINFTLRLQ